ncbi:MAG: tetratricopeptide repeat protein, partial [bacterium]
MDLEKRGFLKPKRYVCAVCALALVILSFTALADSESMIKMEEGKIEFTRQNYEKAISLFEDVIEKEPENGEAQHYIGLCYMGMDEPWKAVPYMKRATKLCPCKVTSYEDMAWATFEAGKHDESIQAANKALALEPVSERGKLYKGLNLMSEGYFQKAMPYFKDLEDSKSYKQSSYYYQGVCLTRLGKTEEAEDYFERARKENPDTELGQNAGRNLKSLEGRAVEGESKPYYIKFRLLYQYDTNIVPVHDEDFLPEDVSEQEDGRIATDLDARYRFFEDKNSYAQAPSIYHSQRLVNYMER